VALLTPAVGLYHDDAVYAVTAKALAEGHGYKIISLPIEISQTKYPVLFPFLLSLVWRVFPKFPENVPWLKLVPFVAGLIWFWLIYRLLKRESGETRLAAGIVLLTMVAPRVLHYSTILLSETLFAALAWGSLWWLRSCERGEGGTLHVLAAAFFAAAAFHTRTIGAVLIVAGVMGLLLVRRTKWALLFGIVSAVLVLPWFLWVAAHEIALPDLYSYYTAANYRDWNVISSFPWAEKVWIVVFNGLALLQAPTWLLGVGHGWLWLLFSFAVGLITLVGFVRDMARGIHVLHLFMLGYVATVLLWAWPSPRFYMPLLPLLLLYGAQEGQRLACGISVPSRRKLVLGVAITVLALPAALRFGETWTLAARHGLVCPLRACRDEWREYLVVLQWLEENTARDAILLSNHDPMIYLYTERKGVGVFNLDPFLLLYAMDSVSAPFQSTEPLATDIAQSGADYVVLTDRQDSHWDPLLWRQFRILYNLQPDLARGVKVGPTPGFAVYRLVKRDATVEHPPDRPAADQPVPEIEDR
jgi:hypothetical protein